MKMGTCADCGQPMHRGTTSLPQGKARCRACRLANPKPKERTAPKAPPPHKAMACAECGRAIWKSSTSRPEGEARCLDCYRTGQVRRVRRGPCVDCGTPSWGERCRPCQALHQTIRAADDYRVTRQQREHSAPGLNSYRRSLLLAKWKRQGRPCAYCPAPADTIDHVVPLVRGGTNYEGNLVPACRKCNGSKAARTIIEWRTGKPSPRATKAPEWKRTPRVARSARIKAIDGEQLAFNVCPECGAMCVNTYCNNTCGSRYAMRRNYRIKGGIPLGEALYQSDKPQWRRTWAV